MPPASQAEAVRTGRPDAKAFPHTDLSARFLKDCTVGQVRRSDSDSRPVAELHSGPGKEGHVWQRFPCWGQWACASPCTAVNMPHPLHLACMQLVNDVAFLRSQLAAAQAVSRGRVHCKVVPQRSHKQQSCPEPSDLAQQSPAYSPLHCRACSEPQPLHPPPCWLTAMTLLPAGAQARGGLFPGPAALHGGAAPAQGQEVPGRFRCWGEEKGESEASGMRLHTGLGMCC